MSPGGRVSSAKELPAMTPLPKAEVDEAGYNNSSNSSSLVGDTAGGQLTHRHLQPMLGQSQGSAMASAG